MRRRAWIQRERWVDEVSGRIMVVLDRGTDLDGLRGKHLSKI